MFVDSVELALFAGNGGAGATSFRREKFVLKGGPDGGDGGKGGNVYFKLDHNCDTLSAFKGKRFLKAKNGQPGEGRKMHGKKGEDLILEVPPGTQVYDAKTSELLLDITDENDSVLFLEGGKGGLGNWHFRSSTNQRPTYSQSGLEGEQRSIRLELKLIADVGLVGFPNVGKSTLVATLSNAKPEIANYEFTTLIPSLGVVDVDYNKSFVIADIPGIISGASEGKGLGIEFLRHIERTKTLLFMIDIANFRDMEEQYKILREELKKFSTTLFEKNFAIAITRCDALSSEEASEKIEKFIKKICKKNKKSELDEHLGSSLPYFINTQNTNKDTSFIIPISSVVGTNIKHLKYKLYELSNLGE